MNNKVLTIAAMLVFGAHAQAAIPDGTYSSVCVYPETDDLGGMELQIGHVGRTITVSLRTCAGGCWQQPTSNITMNGNHLEFSATDQDFDGSGKLVEATVHQFTATLHKADLIVESRTYLQGYDRLKRQASRALTGKAAEWPIPVRRCH